MSHKTRNATGIAVSLCVVAIALADAPGRDFTVTNTRDDGEGSLRRAIENANGTLNPAGGCDRIVFDIPGDGAHVIALASALPPITEAVVVDGFSQVGAHPAGPAEAREAVLLVQLDGNAAGDVSGIVVRASSVTIRGLAITGFAGDGVRIEGCANTELSDNRVSGNGRAGVAVSGDGAVGTAVLANAIFDNARTGIALGPAATETPGIGPNGRQSAPFLTQVTRVPAGDGLPEASVVEGVLVGAPGATFRVDLYATPATRAANTDATDSDGLSVHRQGREWLGAGTIVLDAGGGAPFSVRLPRAIASRALVTAIATDAGGNSSEFSAPIRAPQVTKSWNNAAGGNWSVAGNWTPNGAPTSTDDARIDLAGTYTVTLDVTTTVNSVVIGSAISGTQTLSIAANTLTLNAASSVGARGAITQSGGSISGAGSLTVDGVFTWNGGIWAGGGSTTLNNGLTLGGTANKDLNPRVVTVGGNSVMSGTGAMRFFAGATLTNIGTFDVQSDTGFLVVTGPVSFDNNGTFRKSAGTGTTAISIGFNNAGSVALQSGVVNLSGGGTHTGSFSGNPGTTLQFSAGTHSSSGNIAVAGLSVSGGTVNVNGGTFSASTSTFSGGTTTFAAAAAVSSVGAVTVSGGAVNYNSGETITPASITLSSGTLGGSDLITASGLVTWTGGTIGGSGTFNANAGIALSGAGLKDLNSRTLNLAGSSTMTGTGGMRFTGGVMTVGAGATFDVQADLGFSVLSGSPVINNNGTIRKSAGAGTTSITTLFNNAGTVDVQSGTVNLSANGTHTGSFSGNPGTTLQFSAGTHSSSGNIAVAALSVSGGTVNVNGGTFSASTSTFGGGTTTFAAAAAVSSVGAVTVSGGVVNYNSGETITPASITLSSGTLGGSDLITASGPVTWTGGTIGGSGTLNANAGIALSGAGLKDLNTRTLNLAGSSTMTGTGGMRFTGGVMTVGAGATFDIQADLGFSVLSGSPVINNNGTFRKSAGAGISQVGPPFTNTGFVDALSGTLSLAAPTNCFTQTAGSTTLNGGAITGATAITVQGGTLTGGGTVTGAVTSGGAVTPGNGIGVLNITGNYVQQAGGSFNPQIGGLAAGTQYDQLTLPGASTATLAGTLNVSLANGFTPSDGDAFSVMTFASATGTFATLNFPVLPQGCWLIAYRATDVQLSVTTRTPDVRTARFTNKTTLSWVGLDPRFGAATYDVMRGATNQMPVGGKPGESCLAQNLTGTSFVDSSQPALGQSTYYLVRGKTPCGPGTWGTTSASTERTPTVCP